MSDLAALADTAISQCQGDLEVNHKDHITNDQDGGDIWGITLSPEGSQFKNHISEDSHMTDPTSKKSAIKKSSILKDLMDATSPMLSPLLPQLNKEPQPIDSINFSEATLKQLASETNVRANSVTSPDNVKKDAKLPDTHRLGGKRKISLEEINKRRKARAEEESKKALKQTKDDARGPSRGACPHCGMTNADGLRTACKSCINLRKESKSKETLQLKKKRNKIVVDDNQGKQDHSPNGESPVAAEEDLYTGGENPSKNRSLSLDLNDTTTESLSAFTSKKYRPPKRTSTDLGLNDYSTKPLEGRVVNLSQYKDSPKVKAPTNVSSSGKINDVSSPGTATQAHELKFGPANLELEQKRDKKQTSQTMKPESKHRVLKRSTTDSEIVSKGKIVKDDKKSSGDPKMDNKVQAFGSVKKMDSSKSISGKREHSVSSVKSESPHDGRDTGIVSGYKLERSKTVLGKMNFEAEKRGSADQSETNRTEEGGTNTIDTDKTAQAEAKSKKLFNSVRSHTIIGDGLAKRKQKQESTKLKSGKREGSSVNGKKKLDGKHPCDAEEDKKIAAFIEGETKKPTVEEDIQLVVNNTIPKNLYDYEHEDDSSDSESEDTSEFVECVQSIAGSSVSENISLPVPPPMPTVIKSNSDDQRRPAPVKKWQPPPEPVQPQPQQPAKMPEYGSGSPSSSYDYIPSSSFDNERVETYNRERVETYNRVETCIDDEPQEPAFRPAYSIEGAANLYDDEMGMVGVSQCSSEEKVYNVKEYIYESDEEDAVFISASENAYFADDSCPVCPGYAVPENTEIVRTDNYFELGSSSGREAKIEDYGLSYTDYDPYTISRSDKDVEEEVKEEVAVYTTHCEEELPAEYTGGSYKDSVALQGNGYGHDYFGYETDVDTGLPVERVNVVRQEACVVTTRNEWGFVINDGDSSSSSDDSEKEDEDAWYTGGFYGNKKSKSNTSENDDLIYFNDHAGAQLSDSDIYTGELFSNVDTKGNGVGDMSRNNNIAIEENLCPRSQFRNNISSCPQMHPARSATDVFAQSDDGFLLPFFNLSNNGIYDDDDDYIPALTSSVETNKPKQMVLNRSDYTEYATAVNCTIKPKKDLILFGNKDFSKYDNPRAKELRQKQEESFLPRGDSPKADLVFYAEKNKTPKPYHLNITEQSLYFNSTIPQNVNYDRSFEREQENKIDIDESYQGGFFYASKYGFNDNNNNNNGGKSDTTNNDHYTGCFRNEEEYKPTYEGLFNDKPTSFNFRKRRPDLDTLYFANSNSKTYYDVEDSVYAFEQKEKPTKKKPEKPVVMKVGGIVVRNNVECEVDYAQNINMDLQATSWRRYDTVGDGEAAEGSNYAKNILFEEMAGSRPWAMDDCRAPWKIAKQQSNIGGKIKPETKWKAPDKVVKSVKTLGTYVTKWF